MIVIADTSPLNYLVLIGEADILLRLYHRVVIPEAVLRELLHPETPTIVSEWIARRPTWLEVERISCSRRKFEGPMLAIASVQLRMRPSISCRRRRARCFALSLGQRLHKLLLEAREDVLHDIRLHDFLLQPLKQLPLESVPRNEYNPSQCSPGLRLSLAVSFFF